MRKRAHGVEDMDGMACAAENRGVRLLVRGVGVAEGDNNAAGICTFDEFESAGDFGGEREDFDQAAAGFEIAIEERGGRFRDGAGGMDAATHEADKRAFEMKAYDFSCGGVGWIAIHRAIEIGRASCR